MLKLTTALAALLLGSSAAAATDIHVDRAWSRATPKGAGVAVGYLSIRNAGAGPDRLTGGSTAIAKRIEVHEMSMTGGVMKMRELTGGLVVPAHGSVTLAPLHDHLMFVGLARPLKKGENFPATLSFARSGSVTVVFHVGGIADQGFGGAPGAPQGGKTGMAGMKM